MFIENVGRWWTQKKIASKLEFDDVSADNISA